MLRSPNCSVIGKVRVRPNTGLRVPPDRGYFVGKLGGMLVRLILTSIENRILPLICFCGIQAALGEAQELCDPFPSTNNHIRCSNTNQSCHSSVPLRYSTVQFHSDTKFHLEFMHIPQVRDQPQAEAPYDLHFCPSDDKFRGIWVS